MEELLVFQESLVPQYVQQVVRTAMTVPILVVPALEVVSTLVEVSPLIQVLVAVQEVYLGMEVTEVTTVAAGALAPEAEAEG